MKMQEDIQKEKIPTGTQNLCFDSWNGHKNVRYHGIYLLLIKIYQTAQSD